MLLDHIAIKTSYRELATKHGPQINALVKIKEFLETVALSELKCA